MYTNKSINRVRRTCCGTPTDNIRDMAIEKCASSIENCVDVINDTAPDNSVSVTIGELLTVASIETLVEFSFDETDRGVDISFEVISIVELIVDNGGDLKFEES